MIQFKGLIPVHVGNRLMFKPADVLAWIDAQQSQQRQAATSAAIKIHDAPPAEPQAPETPTAPIVDEGR